MKTRTILAAAFFVLLPTTVAVAEPAPPDVEGPDVPTLTEPAAVVDVFTDEWFNACEGIVRRTKTIDVPQGDFDRIVVELTVTPDGDPWDRLVGLAIGGVEVLRGITPRAEYTLRKDITRYAELLPSGGQATVDLDMQSWVPGLRGSVNIEFYSDEPTAAAVRPAAGEVKPVWFFRSLTGHGSQLEQTVTFGDSAPERAAVEFTLSGHGPSGEFWYQRSPVPIQFHIYVDDVEVATAVAMPYVYALLGFGNENANRACAGPGTTTTGQLIHSVVWWSGHQALDIAGVHTGNGEVPAYRAEILFDSSLAQLTGERTVRVVQERGSTTNANWVNSLAFMLD